VIVIGKVPVTVGVPDKIPPELSVTPVGSVPTSVNDGDGTPDAVTVKIPGALRVNEVLVALVKAGAELIVRVKVCVAAGVTPLVAVRQKVKVPAVELVVLVIVAVDAEPLCVKLTPVG
jgi:hypothetical protein